MVADGVLVHAKNKRTKESNQSAMISPGTWKLFQRGLAPLKACVSLVKSSDVENCRMSESTAVEHLLHEEYKSKTKTKNDFEMLLTTSACIFLNSFLLHQTKVQQFQIFSHKNTER